MQTDALGCNLQIADVYAAHSATNAVVVVATEK